MSIKRWYNGGNVQALALGGDILRRNGSYSKAIEPYEKVVGEPNGRMSGCCFLWRNVTVV